MIKEVLIIAGGEKKNLKELVGEKKENQFIIGVDGGARVLLDFDIAVDVAIGDFDSISEDDLHKLKKEVPEVYVLPTEKDVTDTEAALDYVRKHVEVEKIKMFGLLGGRIDHTISNLWIAYHPGYRDLLEKIIIIEQYNSLQFFLPGVYSLVKESNKKYLSFIGMSPLKKLTLKDVKYPLEAIDYPYPIALISNEFEKNRMNFSFDEGILAVIQSSDAPSSIKKD